MTRSWPIALALVAVLAFVGGRCSVPDLDPTITARADSLADTKKAFNDERTARLELSDSLVTLAKGRDSSARAATAEADRLRASGRVARATAQRLANLLDSAKSAGDSVPILSTIVTNLGTALDSTEAAADSFKAELGRSRDDVRNLILAVGVLRDQVRADSVRLEIQEGVIGQLRKAHSGCRWLGKLRCLRGSVSYDATDGGVMATAVYPLGDLIGVGVSYRLVR